MTKVPPVLQGSWLGQYPSEEACKADRRDDFFQNTADYKFYKLKEGTGVTEIFRGNYVAEPNKSKVALQELTCLIRHHIEDPKAFQEIRAALNNLYTNITQ